MDPTEQSLTEAGFQRVTVRELDPKPVPAVCVHAQVTSLTLGARGRQSAVQAGGTSRLPSD